jgi:hypothetical protein
MMQPKYGFGRLAAVVAAILVPIALSSGPARADGEPARVRGTVASLEGTKLIVHAKDGKDVTITLADKFGAIAVVKASMADIKQGTFIGTATATQPDSTLRSVEVVVFPDNMRGTAEGHYPWDLPGSSMMTNATVSNAVKGVDGQTVTVTYKGGEKKIDIRECARRRACAVERCGHSGRPSGVCAGPAPGGRLYTRRRGSVRQGRTGLADVIGGLVRDTVELVGGLLRPAIKQRSTAGFSLQVGNHCSSGPVCSESQDRF